MSYEKTQASCIQNQQKLKGAIEDGQGVHRSQVSAVVNQIVDASQLQQQLTQLVGHYEILNSHYSEDQLGILWQHCHNHVDVGLTTLDWKNLSSNELAQQKQQLFARSDIPTNSTMWLTVATIGDAKSWLHLRMPSINCDSYTLVHVMKLLLETLNTGQINLPEDVIQYGELAPWLNDYLLDDELADAREFWRKPLTFSPYSSAFGLARYTSSDEQGWGWHQQSLSTVIGVLSELAEQQGASVADSVCASLRQVMGKDMGQVYLSRVLDSRVDEELADAVGPMSRALPLYPQSQTNLADNIAIERQNREEAQDYVELFVPQSSDEQQSFPFVFCDTNGLDDTNLGYIESVDWNAEQAKIQFTLCYQGDNSSLTVRFDRQFISAAAINSLMQQWIKLLTEHNNPAQTNVVDVQINQAPERPALTNIVAGITTKAAAGMGKIISPDGRQLSLAQIDQQANQLAHELMAQGVAKGHLVALAMARSVDFVVALLAVLKTGAAYIPIDLDVPPARVKTMLQESATTLVVVDQALPFEGIKQLDYGVVNWSELDTTAPDVIIDNEDIAYVLYTSGSTGTPKGVAISHRALTNHMRWMNDEFGYHQDDVIAHRTSVGFDASVWELFSPMLAGATLLIVDKQANYDLALMCDTLIDNAVTVLQMVPAQLEVLLEQPRATQLQSLRLMMCGGEALRSALAKQAMRVFDCQVVNLYGPSECCIDATFYRVDESLISEVVPIGSVIDNLSAVVVKTDGTVAVAGEEGELWLSGESLFSGYYLQDELTAAACHTDQSGRVFYKTGDSVRLLADGQLYFLSRIDNQVKINGYRIELDEIARLAENQSLCAKAVCVYDDQSKLLSLFVQHAPDSDTDIDTIDKVLHQFLPQYMVPAQILPIEQMPTLSNGKIDIKSLLQLAKKATEAAYQKPNTEMEIKLEAMWRECLNLDEAISVNSDFFQIGGHSLMAMKIVTLVKELLNIDITLKDIFEYNTIAKLALYLESIEHNDGLGTIEQAKLAEQQQGDDDITEEFEL